VLGGQGIAYSRSHVFSARREGHAYASPKGGFALRESLPADSGGNTDLPEISPDAFLNLDFAEQNHLWVLMAPQIL